MKLKFLMLAVMCVFAGCFEISGQRLAPIPAKESLYIKAIFAGMEARQKAYSKDGGRDYLTGIVAVEEFPLNGEFDFGEYPTVSGKCNLVYLSPEGLIREFKKIKQPLPIMIIRPMINIGNRLVVPIKDYWFTQKGNELKYSLDGGVNVVFEYDAKSNDFVIVDIRLWGV